MTIVNISKAATCGGDAVQDVEIQITGRFPVHYVKDDDSDWVNTNRAFYKSEAKEIVDALQGSLPGGTLEQVLIELLTRKASLWRVTVNG